MEAPVVAAEIDIAFDGREGREAGSIYGVEEGFKFARLAMQTVEVVDEDAIERAGADVIEHAPVLRSRLAGVGAPIIVDVSLGDAPAEPSREGFAVGDLSGYSKAVPLRV